MGATPDDIAQGERPLTALTVPPSPSEVKMLYGFTDPQAHYIPQRGNLEAREPAATTIDLVVSLYITDQP